MKLGFIVLAIALLGRSYRDGTQAYTKAKLIRVYRKRPIRRCVLASNLVSCLEHLNPIVVIAREGGATQ